MRRRGFVHLVGAGPGGEELISLGAERALRDAKEIWTLDLGPRNRERLFLRKYLRGRKVVNLDAYYLLPSVPRSHIYRTIAGRLLHLADRGRRITFVCSGNPLVWVAITDMLKQQAAAGRIDLRITPSMSFLDVIWREMPFSLTSGAWQLRAVRISAPDIDPTIDCVIGQVGDSGTTGPPSQFATFRAALERLYPASHPVFVVGSDPVYDEDRVRATTASELHEVLPEFSGLHHVVVVPRRTAARRRRARAFPSRRKA